MHNIIMLNTHMHAHTNTSTPVLAPMSDVFLHIVCVCAIHSKQKQNTFETPKHASTYILAVSTTGKINKLTVYMFICIYIKNTVIFQS